LHIYKFIKVSALIFNENYFEQEKNLS